MTINSYSKTGLAPDVHNLSQFLLVQILIRHLNIRINIRRGVQLKFMTAKYSSLQILAWGVCTTLNTHAISDFQIVGGGAEKSRSNSIRISRHINLMQITLHRVKTYKDCLFRSNSGELSLFKPVSRKLNFHVSTHASLTGTMYLKSAVFPVWINTIIYPLDR